MKIWLIIFLVLTVSHGVQSQLRLVVNTTCLELAKPSNQQLRLNCHQYDYHCLLDETFTKEFEVCREWKWIPGGKCAYFNTYGSGNVDERECTPGINLTCSQSKQFESNKNTQFSACYAKKESDTSLLTTTSPIQVTPNMTSDGDTATSSPISRAWTVFLIFIVIAFSSVVVMLFILRSKPLYQKDEEQSESGNFEDAKSNQQNSDQESLLNEEEKTTDNKFISQEKLRVTERNDTESLLNEGKKTDNQSISQEKLRKTETERYDNNIERTELTDDKKVHANLETVSLKNEKKETTDNPKAMRHGIAAITGIEKNEGKPGVDKGKISEKDNGEYGDREDYSRSLKRNASATDSNIESKELTDDKKVHVNLETVPLKNEKKETTDNPQAMKHVIVAITGTEKNVKSNVEEDKDESTDVFGDTVKMTAPPTEEQGSELCAELYNLLDNEGLKLTHKVMTATITRETGKSVKTLLYSLTDQDKRKLKEDLPEESHRILESKTEHESSFLVLYGLYRVFLDDEQSPKSGWGNPVGETNVGIGDDIERLYMIHSFVRENSDPKNVPIKSYIRRLDIMKEALTRMDHDAEFKSNLTAFANEISCFKKVLQIK